MSAYDIAVSTRNALRIPVLAHLAAAPSVSFTGPDGVQHTLVNHNRLVADGLYRGANGFKTGFTTKAQHTLVATAKRGDRTLIAVILGTYDAYGWASRLLDDGFGKAAGAGTGQTLPPARVTTYAARALQFAAMRRLASGPPTTSAGTGDTQPPPTSSPVPSAAAGAQVAAAHTTALAATAAAATKKDAGTGGGGLSGTTIAILIVVLLLATLYILRVRAVRRARARRLARRRATNSMMRRGGLPVVDGRYRTGTRVGKPVESHVQLRRDEESGDAAPAFLGGAGCRARCAPRPWLPRPDGGAPGVRSRVDSGHRRSRCADTPETRVQPRAEPSKHATIETVRPERRILPTRARRDCRAADRWRRAR